MAEADYAALVADIRQYGQREVIVLHEGKFLERRNHDRTCLELGPTPITRAWTRLWRHAAPDTVAAGEIAAARDVCQARKLAVKPAMPDAPLSERGRNPERIEKQCFKALLWEQLRGALRNLTSLPKPADMAANTLATGLCRT